MKIEMERKFKIGEKVKYVGPDLVAYEKGKTYVIKGYDEELDLYGLMSELGEVYCVGEINLEKIKS